MNAERIARIIGETIDDHDVAPECCDALFMLDSEQLLDICDDAANRIVKDHRERRARKHGQHR